ncbi:unnamed protein product, partial [Prorocentrum cordatum]
MSWDIWRTWGRVEMPRRAPPMSVAMLCGIVHVLWRLGRQDAAVLILVAFHCLLRTGELMSIRAEHVLINASRAGLAALPWTESGARRGAQELVTVDDPVVGRALAWLRQRQGAGPLRLGTGAQFRLLFERACVQAGVEEVGLKPYSLRRGGATRDMCTRGDLGRAVHRGRWSDLRTAQIYINDGLAALAQRRVPGTTTTALRQAVRLLGVGARHAAGRPALPLLGDEEGGGGSWVPADDQDVVHDAWADLQQLAPCGGPAVDEYLEGLPAPRALEMEGGANAVRLLRRSSFGGNLGLLCRAAVNSMTLAPEGPVRRAMSARRAGSWPDVGVGLYPSGAMLNHSCEPSCLWFVRGGILVVEALRGVRRGEELTIQYLPVNGPFQARRRRLQEAFGFRCLCRRCGRDEARHRARLAAQRRRAGGPRRTNPGQRSSPARPAARKRPAGAAGGGRAP